MASSLYEPFTPVDAVPRLEWRPTSPGHWSARRGVLDVGSIRHDQNGFTALDAAGFDLGALSAFAAAQAAIALHYTDFEGAPLWIPDRRRDVVAERARAAWNRVLSRFDRKR
jgi:hypothetical protein